MQISSGGKLQPVANLISATFRQESSFQWYDGIILIYCLTGKQTVFRTIFRRILIFLNFIRICSVRKLGFEQKCDGTHKSLFPCMSIKNSCFLQLNIWFLPESEVQEAFPKALRAGQEALNSQQMFKLFSGLV